MLVRNLKSAKGNTIANQFIIDNDYVVYFQSYESIIITLDLWTKTIFVHEDYNYSKTTGKYRNLFFEEYGFSGLANIKTLEKALQDGFYEDFKVKKAA